MLLRCDLNNIAVEEIDLLQEIHWVWNHLDLLQRLKEIFTLLQWHWMSIFIKTNSKKKKKLYGKRLPHLLCFQMDLNGN